MINFSIIDLRVEIWIRNLKNAKKGRKMLGHDVWRSDEICNERENFVLKVKTYLFIGGSKETYLRNKASKFPLTRNPHF
jgi:hypothetical protein